MKLTNVKKHLGRVEETCRWMLEDNGKYPNGLKLPPAYVEELNSLRFMTKTILRLHEAKKTRKDIQIGA